MTVWQDPAARAALAAALVGWLPQRRWFAGKGRELGQVEVAELVPLEGGRAAYVLALADGRPTALLLHEADGEEPGALEIAGRRWRDVADEPAAAAALTTTVDAQGVVAGRVLAVDAGPAPLPTTFRRLGAEQSNTTVAGDGVLLKLLRHPDTGAHPDVDVPRALAALERPAPVPAVVASWTLNDPRIVIAIASELVPDATDAFADAVSAVADTPSAARYAGLGEAVAVLHDQLAEAFGSMPLRPADVTALAARVADTAESLDGRPVDVGEAAEELASLPPVGPLQRIHGDLHLGQVLLDDVGRWWFIDFEGEPARAASERTAPDSPLRDVAGILRSFDYAAATAERRGVAADAAARWRDAARHAFIDAYLAATAWGSAAAAADAEALLRAYELDKAVYEIRYEQRARPAWVDIPVAGVRRLLQQRGGAMPTDPTPEPPVPPTPEPEPPASGKRSAAKPAASKRAAKSPPQARPPQPSAPEAPAPGTPTVSADDIRRIQDGLEREPHRILGIHTHADGAVVRTYRPDAHGVTVVVGGEEYQAVETAPAFFEAALPKLDPAYRLRVRYEGGEFELDDSYRFLPTLGELDIHLASEGRHEELWKQLGAHPRRVDGIDGVAFAVWAPNARAVRVVGDFNSWDGRLTPMRTLGSSGIWELFVPGVGQGDRYKFELITADGRLTNRADPFAAWAEEPPATASRVFVSSYEWGDEQWLRQRAATDQLARPLSIYEVHLGSWRRTDDGRVLGYRELGEQLADHVGRLGFTHVELLPPLEHPFAGSWGYQVTGYFAPTSRHGDPDDFRALVDTLHQRGIGVIVDWVPAHFPKDEFALARFDGTALYEHEDPRRGEHPDWGTLVFNYARNEVRNFLLASALFWLEEMHIDGLRVDAVASMLYLDYSRKDGEWVPNEFGGRENLAAVRFVQELNAVAYGRDASVLMIAEESTAWPGVSRPTHLGGLGFGYKWNMGWMHDTLSYFSKEPVYRRFHHNQLTFAMMYAYSEQYVLPLSHDEVVHGKGSLLGKMPGDRWQQLANLRALYAWMWSHPGKQLLFMGAEVGQEREWDADSSVDWHLLGHEHHAGLSSLLSDLNRVYRETPALWQLDHDPAGFRWIDANNADDNVLSFVRWDAEGRSPLVCVANLAPVPRRQRFGMPWAGRWEEVLNTDADLYGGSGVGNLGGVDAHPVPHHGLDASAEVTLPPLGVVWFKPDA